MWFISKHKELKERNKMINDAFDRDRKEARIIQETVIAPAMSLRGQDDFSEVIRNSLLIGHK